MSDKETAREKAWDEWRIRSRREGANGLRFREGFDAGWDAAQGQQWVPLCEVHKRLDDADKLEVVIQNDCMACTLHQRTEMLDVLAEFAPDGSDPVQFLRKICHALVQIVGSEPMVIRNDEYHLKTQAAEAARYRDIARSAIQTRG